MAADPSDQIHKAWKHLNGKYPEDAISIGKKLVQRGHSSGYEILGRAYLKLGELDNARRYRPGDRENPPPDTVSDLIPNVARSGRPDIALHIHARENAALLNPPMPESEAPSKSWWRKLI